MDGITPLLVGIVGVWAAFIAGFAVLILLYFTVLGLGVLFEFWKTAKHRNQRDEEVRSYLSEAEKLRLKGK